MVCNTGVPEIGQRICFFGTLHVIFRNGNLRPCLIYKHMSIVISFEQCIALSSDIVLYIRERSKVVTPVKSAQAPIMSSTLYGFRLLPVPWFTMTLYCSDRSRNDASNSALFQIVPPFSLSFVTLIFLLVWVEETAIRVCLLALYCSRRRIFQRLKGWNNFK